MKSSLAVLGAATLASAASIHHHHHHGHAHLHNRHAPVVAVPQEKRDATYINSADVSSITSRNFLVGKNIACADQGSNPVTVGNTGGPFVVEFNNKGTEDIVLVSWSGSGQWGAVAAMFIGAQQPDVTYSLPANSTAHLSFDPSKISGGILSGGFGAIYPNTTLTSYSGQLGNTIGEFTFRTDNAFSTTDVSRLIDMNGQPMEIHNFPTQSQASNIADAACSSTMTKCVFQCGAGVDNCIYGGIVNCPVGEAGNTSDGVDNGGCGGMTQEGGYVVVNFS